jgi:hypothetical protein
MKLSNLIKYAERGQTVICIFKQLVCSLFLEDDYINASHVLFNIHLLLVHHRQNAGQESLDNYQTQSMLFSSDLALSLSLNF